MRLGKSDIRVVTGIACAAVLAALTGTASAADAITVPLDPDNSVPVAEHRFDWSGFYAGMFGSVRQGTQAGGQLGVGINAGANAQLSIVLVGAEVTLQGLGGERLETAYGEVLGRGGLVLTDEVLLYAAAGYGWDLAGGGSGALAGGGVEFAVTDDISLRAEYLRGFDTTGTAPTDQVKLGASFHF